MEASASPANPRGYHIQTGSYTLRKVLSDIPLSADGNDQDVRITCVEFWSLLPAHLSSAIPANV